MPSVPISEFVRWVRELSEDGGYFRDDSFTSNETGYLHVMGKLGTLGVRGGAYVGVGPEQNFSYIAKIRPEIAFVVDIRREMLIQHLMYKAIFHHARDRAAFMALLFSKEASDSGRSLADLLDAIAAGAATHERFTANLATIRETIEIAFQFPLAPSEAQSLEHVYRAFWQAGPAISYGPGFARLRDLLLESDLDGKQASFLANEADYAFVRSLHQDNRVIPLVGDFAGASALAGVAEFLAQQGIALSAFYTSNVEEYLFQDRTFGKFADNVGKFAISDRSVFVRSLRGGWAERHPENDRGYARISLVGEVAPFLQDYRDGASSNYWKLITRNCLAVR